MDTQRHDLHDLFLQLGLPTECDEIDAFLARHRPLRADLELAAAPFWSPAQAAFLGEQVAWDADWTELVDRLDVMLRA
jgi:hypothetical protein